MKLIETQRLVLREFSIGDGLFILELLNDPAFIKYIADREVRTLADAENYLRTGPMASYAEHGFGLYLVEEKETADAMGMCGLVKRDGLADVDIGYAFLPAFRGKGFAFEAAEAVLRDGFYELNLPRIVGITAAENAPSIRVLKKLGLQFERMITLPGDDEEIMRFGLDRRD